MKGHFQAIAFDLDGVLWDSTECHARAFDQVLRAEGIDDFSYPQYAGMRTPEVFADVYRKWGRTLAPDQCARLSAAKSQLARELIESNPPIVPGCLGVLQNLGEDHLLALASSGSRESVALFLRLSGSAGCFSSVLSGNDVKDAKPAPEIYRRTAERLGIEPRRMLVVEDAPAGTQAGREAGAVVIGISRNGGRTAELRASGALDVVEDLEQMMRWIRGNAK